MMTQAFYTGIAGLKTSSSGIDVTSNNIANISTTGFRGYMAEYSTLFETPVVTGTVNPSSIGSGVQMQTTSMLRSQGSLALSDRSTDVAIEGNGWFGISGNGATNYTRDGGFTFDSNSDLVTADGYYVLGTLDNNISKDNVLLKKQSVTELGNLSSQTKLRFPKTLTYPPEPSTKAKFLANLGVGNDPITVGASVVDPKNNKNHLRLEFVKNPVQTPPGNQYTVTATIQSLDGQTIYDTKTGAVEFDASGALVSNTLTSINNNGASVSIDLGNGYDGITSIDVPVVSGSSITDGTIGGDLAGYAVNRNAEVIATFTNGEQSSVGKIAVYHFANEQGLDRVSGTRFKESPNSGAASFYKDANEKNINGAEVVNFRLESSNVELSSGLTELIILQRSFDANSKSITTADEMIQKALKM